jgi:chromosome partitioning protein
MKRVVAIGGLKGGSGKSTLAVNLAFALAEGGGRVALLDLDAQGTAAAWLRDNYDGVRVESVPADTGGVRWTERCIAHAREADVVLLDLPSVMRGTLAAALSIADAALIPVLPSPPDIRALEPTIRLLRMAREGRAGQLPRAWLVPNRVPEDGVEPELVEALAGFGVRLAPPIHQHELHVQAAARKTWVGALAPGSQPHLDVLAIARLLVEHDLRRATQAALAS